MNLLLGAMALTQVVLGGENIGFGIDPPGLLISGTYDIKIASTIYNPRNQDIRAGDIIIEAEGRKIDNLRDLNQTIGYNSDDDIRLQIQRDGQEITRDLTLYTVGDQIKTGLYVKEEVLGIGTLTFYDPQTSMFGALGHPAKDGDGSIVPVEKGSLYASDVKGIKKSSANSVGQKNASLEHTVVEGEIYKNTEYGLLGKYYETPTYGLTYEIGSPDEVVTGPAQMYTVIEGNKKQAFDIQITNLKTNSRDGIKGISFEITDSNLLRRTGGIVAGMSGSPIVQNHKLVGAVTHAITKNPATGYGIFITNMIAGLEAS